MTAPDILVFMSDQHTPVLSSAWGGVADTPHLQALCRAGTDFAASYTACPLCVPARMAMLAGALPSRTGILTNSDTLSDLDPTFVHALANGGYETTLVGRMHFIGPEQRHGFTNRLVGDTTPTTWARPVELLRQIRGVHLNTYRDTDARDVIGGGDSPVLDYDEAVVQAAVDYLARPHDKPQFILVGTYGPHFPYVAPPELYQKYLARVSPPAGHDGADNVNPRLKKRAGDGVDAQTAKRALAAYCGMIEHTDSLVGRVKAAWDAYLAQGRQKGVFVYLSDHGDMCARRGLLGKSTFYEQAARIPFVFQGSGIAASMRHTAPVSLLDLGPTLCDLAGVAPPPGQDGVSLLPQLRGAPAEAGRTVVSELLDDVARPLFARMVRQGAYKLIDYHGLPPELYRPEDDPEERDNLAPREPERVAQLQELTRGLKDHAQVEQEQELRDARLEFIRRFETLTDRDNREMWTESSDGARLPPVVQ